MVAPNNHLYVRTATDSGRKLYRAQSVETCHIRGPEQTQHELRLLDHLVGAGEQLWRHVEAERLRSDQADDQIESCWLLDRQITWSGPAENLVNIVASAPEEVREARSIRDKTTRFDIFATAVHRR